VSIDVEGHEVEVLAGFDLARWRPRLLLIEDVVQSLDLHRHLVARGYRWIRRTGINSWYAPADAPFRVDLKGARNSCANITSACRSACCARTSDGGSSS